MGNLKDLARKAFALAGYEIRRKAFRWGMDSMADLRRVIGAGPHTFLDIGANCGQTAEHLLRAFPASSVHSFEPIPEALEKLRALAARTRGINVLPFALGSAEGTAPFNVAEGTVGSSLLKFTEPGAFGAWSIPVREITVQVRRLDRVWPELNLARVDLLKTDTQGFDLEVLKGAGELLNPGTVRSILAEVNFLTYYTGQSKAHDILAFLEAKGYRPVAMYEGWREPSGRLHWVDMLFA
jgi:FkbM family methyltransferase